MALASATTATTVSAATPFVETYLPYVLRRADQTLSSPFYAVLDRYGIARSDWRVLAVLHDRGGMTVVDLAAAALSPQPTVTHAVRRLEDRGLVDRRRGVHDKRQRVVSITPAGSELAGTLIAEARRLEAEALSDVSDVDGLVQRLREVTATLEATVAARLTAEVSEVRDVAGPRTRAQGGSTT